MRSQHPPKPRSRTNPSIGRAEDTLTSSSCSVYIPGSHNPTAPGLCSCLSSPSPQEGSSRCSLEHAPGRGGTGDSTSGPSHMLHDNGFKAWLRKSLRVGFVEPHEHLPEDLKDQLLGGVLVCPWAAQTKTDTDSTTLSTSRNDSSGTTA